MAGKRLVYKHTVEGLLKPFEASITPALTQKLAALGISLSSLEPVIEAELYGALFDALRLHLYPDLPEQAAARLMGTRFLDGYFSTVMGGVVKTLVKLLPVDVVVERLPRNMMSGANFIEARVEKREPRHYDIVMSDHSTSPGFLMGMVQRMVEFSGGKDVQVELVSQQGRAITFSLKWS